MRRLARIGSLFIALALVASACQGAPAASETDKPAAATSAAQSKAEPPATGEAAKAEVPAVPSTDVPEAKPAEPAAAEPAAAEPAAKTPSDGKNPMLPFSADKEGMSPMPASALRTKLEALQKQLEVDKIFADETSSEQLLAVLPTQVGDFVSMTLPDPAAQGVGVPGRAVMREYIKGEVAIHAVVFDAGKVPESRRVFGEYLVLVGNEEHGNQHPYIGKDGLPGMEAYVANMEMSFATTLVNKRHMVVIIARPTQDPNEARRFIDALDFTPLR
jgi:hypothetical protein